MNEHDETPNVADDLAALRAENAALQDRLREAGKAAHDQLIRAELKAEALRAGMVDLDGLKLLPPDTVTCDENGTVLGADTAMAQLKNAKPWLFHTGNSSSSAQAPPSAPTRPKLATDMTLAEWRSARADLLRRH
jgi:hypothetical protein